MSFVETSLNALDHAPRNAGYLLLELARQHGREDAQAAVLEMAQAIHRLKEQTAQVRVDKDRAVRDAMARALDCDQHGADLHFTQERVHYFSTLAEQRDRARVVLVNGLFQIDEFVRALQQRIRLGGSVPTVEQVIDALIKASTRLHAAHDRAWKKKT